MTPRLTSSLVLALASSATLLAPSARAESKSAAKVSAPSAKPAAGAPPAKGEASPKADAVETPAQTDAPADTTPVPDKESEAAPKGPGKDASLVADAEAGSSAVELSGQTYLGVGLRYRAIIVPKFMMNLFGDGGRTVLANGLGPEFTIRKNAFEYELSAMFTSYAMDPTPFKSSSDGADAWELVESKIKVLYLTADFMWSQNFSPEFAFNYGFGAGFGLVWGDLRRTQAYPGSASANDATGAGYLPCVAQGRPNAVFCGNDNNHYNGYTEPNWANGGSKPLIFPWLAVQTGVRWKPHRNFIARFDAGFGTSGFFLGLGADYGL